MVTVTLRLSTRDDFCDLTIVNHPRGQRKFASYHKSLAMSDAAQRVKEAIDRMRGALAAPAAVSWEQVGRPWLHADDPRYRSVWHERNPGYSRKWRLANPHLVTAAKIARRRSVKQATPQWVDPEAFRPIYEEARRIPELIGVAVHVDHVVPLNGKTVSGLHVPWNLQILDPFSNASKGNRFAS